MHGEGEVRSYTPLSSGTSRFGPLLFSSCLQDYWVSPFSIHIFLCGVGIYTSIQLFLGVPGWQKKTVFINSSSGDTGASSERPCALWNGINMFLRWRRSLRYYTLWSAFRTHPIGCPPRPDWWNQWWRSGGEDSGPSPRMLGTGKLLALSWEALLCIYWMARTGPIRGKHHSIHPASGLGLFA